MRPDRFAGWFRRHPLVVLSSLAILLRLAMFLGRDSYVAFDEGWYLLLGRNLFHGRGYTLSGLQHVALSPLFPILAGALDRIADHPVWAGRIVAALTAGLLVVPCYYLFRRLSGRRTALIGAGVVAVMPSLAPFVTAFWIGWDLWVGSEPLLHLAAYAGLALVVAGRVRRRSWLFALAGLAFALAYMARGEGIIVFGLATAALGVHAVWRRDAPQLGRILLLAAVFAVASAPYWVYLHDVTGQWTITGRGSKPTVAIAAVRREERPAASRTIERMLWQDEDAPYVRSLFALDRSGTRLANSYWGVPRSAPATSPVDTVPAPSAGTDTADTPAVSPGAAPGNGSAANARGTSPTDTAAAVAAPQDTLQPVPARDDEAPATTAPAPPRGPFAGSVLYLRSINRIVPWLLWPLLLLGVFLRRRRPRFDELLVAGTVLGTSAIIAVAVAIDPRTQLIVVPLAAFYIARGLHALGFGIDRIRNREQTSAGIGPRRGFGRAIVVALVLVVLLAVNARRLYFSVSLGSPHTVVG
ncbi:MAG: glycosyltransferase family 39 protein, partial [Gemmatimonadota bacterium]